MLYKYLTLPYLTLLWGLDYPNLIMHAPVITTHSLSRTLANLMSSAFGLATCLEYGECDFFRGTTSMPLQERPCRSTICLNRKV